MERELIEALTEELENAETTLQNLIAVLRAHEVQLTPGLASQVHDRQREITAAARRGRAWIEQQETRDRWDSEG